VSSGKFILAATYLRRVRVVGRSFAAASAFVSTRLRLRQKKLGVGIQRPCRGQTCGGMLEVSRDAAAAGEEQLGRCAVEQGIYNRLSAQWQGNPLGDTLRRVRVVGRTFAAALTHVSRVVTPPVLEAQKLGVGLQRPCRGQTCNDMLEAMRIDNRASVAYAAASFRLKPRFKNFFMTIVRA
jgi:hypothetical protein